MRRGLVVAMLLCLAGAALVLLSTSRVWLSFDFSAAALLPARKLTVSGRELVPGATALGLVGLAAVAALPATRSWGRTLVGALVTVAGAGVIAVVVRAVADPSGALSGARDLEQQGNGFAFGFAFGGHRLAVLGGWPYLALMGGLLLFAAGVLVLVRGRRWAGLGARYDAPAPEPAGDASQWDALDRGDDPTTT